MGVGEAPHLWILESVFLQAIIAQGKLMSATILADLLVMGSTDSKRDTLRHHIHLRISSQLGYHCVLIINGFGVK